MDSKVIKLLVESDGKERASYSASRLLEKLLPRRLLASLTQSTLTVLDGIRRWEGHWKLEIIMSFERKIRKMLKMFNFFRSGLALWCLKVLTLSAAFDVPGVQAPKNGNPSRFRCSLWAGFERCKQIELQLYGTAHVIASGSDLHRGCCTAEKCRSCASRRLSRDCKQHLGLREISLSKNAHKTS